MAAEVRVEERHEEKEKSETETPLTIEDFTTEESIETVKDPASNCVTLQIPMEIGDVPKQKRKENDTADQRRGSWVERWWREEPWWTKKDFALRNPRKRWWQRDGAGLQSLKSRSKRSACGDLIMKIDFDVEAVNLTIMMIVVIVVFVIIFLHFH